ncbi:hypothetical protein ACGFI9_12170 [Micromonospora sp. NPDC048930]|uniref:hypothetical protein n=1 Tax=Micromonospora sp. NPDC048930 TaxID=3364261 RepID=UPI003717C672
MNRSAVAGRRAAALVVKGAEVLGSLVRSVPGAAGALLVAYGAWDIYPPAGFITAGAFLLLADRQIP